MKAPLPRSRSKDASSAPTKRTPRGGFKPSADGKLTLVTRDEVSLMEYGPTPFPAYSDAAVVGVRGQLLSHLLTGDALADLAELLATRDSAPDEATDTPTGAVEASRRKVTCSRSCAPGAWERSALMDLIAESAAALETLRSEIAELDLLTEPPRNRPHGSPPPSPSGMPPRPPTMRSLSVPRRWRPSGQRRCNRRTPEPETGFGGGVQVQKKKDPFADMAALRSWIRTRPTSSLGQSPPSRTPRAGSATTMSPKRSARWSRSTVPHCGPSSTPHPRTVPHSRVGPHPGQPGVHPGAG